MAAKWTQEKFLAKSQEVWGDRWDYSFTKYSTSKAEVCITCREHGPFFQIPQTHLQGRVGCKSCIGISHSTESFIQRSREVWGNRWGYSKVRYQDSKIPVIITCLTHGEFEQSPNLHLRKVVSCRGCNPNITSKWNFIQKSKGVWGEDRWDYANTEFLSMGKEVTVGCKQHGEFRQTAKKHLSNSMGCLLCSHSTMESFLFRAREVWGNRWDYSRITSYKGNKGKLPIVCPQHGTFYQSPEMLLQRRVGCSGCQSCKTSLSEHSLGDMIKSHSVKIDKGRRDLLGNRQELDIYLPKNKIAFEFNGVYYHSEKFKDSKYHYNKYKAAADKGITLYQVWEDDWNLRQEIVERHIKQVLGKSDLPRVYARKLSIVEVSTGGAKEFLEANHIQGFASGSAYVGGFYKGDLVALAVFKRAGKDYTLVRYATSAHVIGGHSKLVSYFERNYIYRELVTFADLTFGDGDLYRKTGWVEDKLLPPDYSYLVRGERKHKFGYRLKRFRDDPELVFEEGKTERELAQMNKLLRVYDAGKIRFKKPHPQSWRMGFLELLTLS